MKISIRPAPHSKSCAWGKNKSWCSKFDNDPLRCETECPEGWCCEMKHCWQVGEKLCDILVARGHEVMMANKKYRKGTPSSKASEETKLAMAELLAWGPDVHIAIHTNSFNDVVTGVRIGYPDIAYNKGENARVAESKRLAEAIVAENKKIYHTPSKVITTTYKFYELNKPDCPAVYIEGCFANSAKKDADWWHDNMDAIALAYADGIEAWGGKATDEPKKEADFMAYSAYVKTRKGGGASIWSDNKKTRRVVYLQDGDVVYVTGEPDSKGFVPVEVPEAKGVFDSQYLVKIETPAPEAPEVTPDAPTDETLLDKLQAIKALVDEAIELASKA